MAIEARRGCGFRKADGIYLCSDGLGAPCGKLPFALHICPTCGGGIKQSRGWQWIDLPPLLANVKCEGFGGQKWKMDPAYCAACPLGDERIRAIGKVGLLWIGAQFYPTVAQFEAEARQLGISRRIKAVPRNFKLGETWVLLAHAKGMACQNCGGAGLIKARPGVVTDEAVKCAGCKATGWVPAAFRLFQPQRIEKLITESQSKDEEFMAKLDKDGMTPVVVPDGDRDHQGSIWDKEDSEEAEVAAA